MKSQSELSLAQRLANHGEEKEDSGVYVSYLRIQLSRNDERKRGRDI